MRTIHFSRKLVLDSWFLVLASATLLVACSAAVPAPADRAAELATARPAALPATSARPRVSSAASASSAPAPQRAPKPTASIHSGQADPPTLAPSTPTSAPIRAVVETRSPQPIRAATATPLGIPTQRRAPAELHFRASDPGDHYVAIREQPTTKSREVGRLMPGDLIVCSGIVAGETLEYLGQKSNRWATCPSVGGSIFLPLLILVLDTS